MSNALGMMVKPYQSGDWYASYLEILSMLEFLSTQDNVYIVAPRNSNSEMGADIAAAVDRRAYPTINDAITVAQKTDGYPHPKTIFVAPGDYAEHVLVGGSINIKGLGVLGTAALGMGTRIIGANVDTLLKITPPESQTIAVNLENIGFECQAGTVIGAISKAYAIDIMPQTLYGPYGVYVGLRNCQLRMQTYGSGNRWLAGIRGRGMVRLVIDQSEIAALNYQGGIEHVIHLEGDIASSKQSTLRMRRCDIDHRYSLGTGDHLIFYGNNGTGGMVHDCNMSPSTVLYVAQFGPNGSNAFTGTAYSEYNNGANSIYKNIVNEAVSFTWL